MLAESKLTRELAVNLGDMISGFGLTPKHLQKVDLRPVF